MNESRSEAVRAERLRRLQAIARTAEPTDWATVLAPLIDRAETIGAGAFAEEMQLEVWANGTYAQASGRPEHSARFSFVPPAVQEPAALDLIGRLASEAEAPPLVRAHEWDLIWFSESSPRAHSLAGSNAAKAYLEYAGAVADEVFAEEEALHQRLKLVDALARAAELARETNQPAIAAEVRDQVRHRLAQISAQQRYRYLLELGYALIDIEPLAPGCLADVDALIDPAVDHLKLAHNFDLARAILRLAIDARRARASNDPELPVIETSIAASFVEEADDKAAAGASAGLVAIFLGNAVRAYQNLPGSAAKVAALSARLDQANLGSLSDLKPVTGQISMPSEKVEGFIAQFANQPFPDALALIAGHFLQDRAESYRRSAEQTSKFVFSSLASLTVLTQYGETIHLAAGSQARKDHEAFRDSIMGISADRGVANMKRLLRWPAHTRLRLPDP